MNLGKYLTITALCVLATGCTKVNVDVGREAVLIEKPWIFGHGGVNEDAIKTGVSYAAFSTDYIEVDMQPKQYQVDLSDATSLDGVPLQFHAALRVRITDSVKMVKKFGEKWYENNVQLEFANRIRTAVKHYHSNEVVIDPTITDRIDKEVSEGLTGYLKRIDLPAEVIAMTVGRANPPDSIKNQRTETAAQQQRVITEGQRKLAEDARKNAEESKGIADRAYADKFGISPGQYAELEKTRMCVTSQHCTLILGTATPVVPIR